MNLSILAASICFELDVYTPINNVHVICASVVQIVDAAHRYVLLILLLSEFIQNSQN